MQYPSYAKDHPAFRIFYSFTTDLLFSYVVLQRVHDVK